jgi:isopropylmalate/homocitrate/citramalate synthase
MYPRCAESFKKWYLSSYKFGKIYNDLGKPKPFDVTLRDGLQSLTKEEQNNLTTSNKLKIYNDISIYRPRNIEIGSIVSEKVLPVFKDTLELFEILTNLRSKDYITNQKKENYFIVIPNQNKLDSVLKNPKFNYFSFITSVSNSFQLKNTKMSLEESDRDIYEMLYELDVSKYRGRPPFVKLYVSCINECPIEGKVDNDFIVHRLLTLNKMNVDSICLSDTCGTLNEEDFEYIVDTCAFFGLPLSKFSLHLHVNKNREKEVEKIIHKALDRKIINFDVSLLDSGGCSVTMNREKISPNLSYDLYYKSLCNYIMKKTL